MKHFINTILTVLMLATTAFAYEVQRLDGDTAVGLGYNYAARIRYSDITNTAAVTTFKLFPASSSTATFGWTISKAAVLILQKFQTAGMEGTSHRIDLTIGLGNTASLSNRVMSAVQLGSNATVLAFATNTVFTWGTNVTAGAGLIAQVNMTNTLSGGGLGVTELTNGHAIILLDLKPLNEARGF
jgi:hypothetical protein